MKKDKLKKLIKKTIREQQQDINVDKADSMGGQGLEPFDPNAVENPLLIKDPTLDLTGAGQSGQSSATGQCYEDETGPGITWNMCSADYQGPAGTIQIALLDVNAAGDSQQANPYDGWGVGGGVFDTGGPQVQDYEGTPCVNAIEITDSYICCGANNNNTTPYESTPQVTIQPVGGGDNVIFSSWTYNAYNEGTNCYCPDPWCTDEGVMSGTGPCDGTTYDALISCFGDPAADGIPSNEGLEGLNEFDQWLQNCANDPNGIDASYIEGMGAGGWNLEIMAGSCTDPILPEEYCPDAGLWPQSPYDGIPACNYDPAGEALGIGNWDLCDYSCIACGNEEASNTYEGDPFGASLTFVNDDVSSLTQINIPDLSIANYPNSWVDCDGYVDPNDGVTGCCQMIGCSYPQADNYEEGVIQASPKSDETCDFHLCPDPSFDNYVCNNPTNQLYLCTDNMAELVTEPPVNYQAMVDDPTNFWWPNTNLGTFDATFCLDDPPSPKLGCTIIGANNYDPLATIDDCSCQHNHCFDEFASVVNADGDAVSNANGPYNIYYFEDPQNILGCGTEYVPYMDVNENSTSFDVEGAGNGDPNVLQDNDFCVYEGCRHPEGGTIVGSPNTPIDNTVILNNQWDDDITLYYYNDLNSGCQDPSTGEINFNDSSCCARPGCPDPDAAGDIDGNLSIEGDCCGTDIVYGATYDPAGYGPAPDDPNEIVPNSCLYNQFGCGTENSGVVTNPNAVNAINYGGPVTDGGPTDDDGSCIYGKDVLAVQCDPPLPDFNALIQEFTQYGQSEPIYQILADVIQQELDSGCSPDGINAIGTEDCPRLFPALTIGQQSGIDGVNGIEQYMGNQPGGEYTEFAAMGNFYDLMGCMDELACNFMPWATIPSAAACTYPTAPYDCNGECVSDSDGDGVCDELEISGCTEEGSYNYNCANGALPGYVTANGGNCYDGVTEDDGSCIPVIEGCLDPDAANFAGEGNTNNFDPPANVMCGGGSGTCCSYGCVFCDFQWGQAINYPFTNATAWGFGGFYYRGGIGVDHEEFCYYLKDSSVAGANTINSGGDAGPYPLGAAVNHMQGCLDATGAGSTPMAYHCSNFVGDGESWQGGFPSGQNPYGLWVLCPSNGLDPRKCFQYTGQEVGTVFPTGLQVREDYLNARGSSMPDCNWAGSETAGQYNASGAPGWESFY